MSEWYVYILRCADNSLYTGMTTDVPRRLDEHNTHNRRAAAYTRGRRPVTLVYTEVLPTRSDALKRENEIKRLDRVDKQRLIQSLRLDNKGFE